MIVCNVLFFNISHHFICNVIIFNKFLLGFSIFFVIFILFYFQLFYISFPISFLQICVKDYSFTLLLFVSSSFIIHRNTRKRLLFIFRYIFSSCILYYRISCFDVSSFNSFCKLLLCFLHLNFKVYLYFVMPILLNSIVLFLHISYTI